MSLINDVLASAMPGPLKTAFGDAITYTPSGNTPVEITAIISDPAPPEAGYPGNVTLAEVLLSDLAATPTQGDGLTFNGVNFVVFDVKTDSIGFAKLALQKTAA